jgi:hypothetical protein
MTEKPKSAMFFCRFIFLEQARQKLRAGDKSGNPPSQEAKTSRRLAEKKEGRGINFRNASVVLRTLQYFVPSSFPAPRNESRHALHGAGKV